jgi:pimeloyl-ACP methyl ester carboxylesterase
MRQLLELNVDDGGSGSLTPAVFLHSTAGNNSHWALQLDHLRPERRTVAVEWRGNGRSPAPVDGDYSFPTMAADVGQAVARLGLDHFVLVGHSGGGVVALQ